MLYPNQTLLFIQLEYQEARDWNLPELTEYLLTILELRFLEFAIAREM